MEESKNKMERSISLLRGNRPTRHYQLIVFHVVVLLFSSMVPKSSSVPVRSNQQSADSADYSNANLSVPFIINGEPTSHCQWPWMTAIMTSEGRFVCGATLISDEWLLTAAHCVYNSTGHQLYAAIGAYNLTAQDAVVNIAIEEVIINEGYIPSSHGVNDIAMLRLASRVDMNYSNCIEAINLPQPDYDAIENSNCSIIGWGRISSDATTGISDVLTQKNAAVITNEVCQRRWGMSVFNNNAIYPQNVCIDEKYNVSACQGDSGSPLQCYVSGRGWTIVGVSSWGSAACRWYPSVYMRVSSFDSWITSIMAPAAQ